MSRHARPACRALALAALAWLGASGHAAAQAPGGAPPPAVTVAPVESREISPSAEFIARVQAIQSVDVRARVQGFLQQVNFQEGQDVKKGDLLYVIEPDQYQAALASAQAQLQGAKATLLQAQENLARNQQLRTRGNVAEATVEQATAQRDTAQANVTAAQAAVEQAQLNLSYTRITSPIDGRIGATAVTIGNLVGPTSPVLATVVELDPIRVVFSINERDFVAYKQQNPNASQQEINARFVPSLRLPDGTMYKQTGRVAFVSNQVDPATGTLPVYADFPNPQRVLLPGMLATAVVRPEEAQRGLVVPLAAVQQDRQGKFVLVVDSNDRVEQRRIEATRQVGQEWVVTSGLREGEEVIVEGVQKAHPGEQVKPVAQSQVPAQ